MWRGSLLIRRAIPLIRNQLIANTQTPIPSLSINPRFFSINPTSDDQNPHFDDTQTLFSQEIDPHLVNFDFPSQEPDTHLGHFSEDHNLISQESETPLDDFIEDQNFISQEAENGGNEDGMSSIGNEDQVVEAETDTEQVEKVLSLLQSSLDGSLESNLDALDLNLSDEFMVRVIETPLVSGNSLIRFFKWASKKLEVSPSARVIHCLVKAVGGGGKIREVYSLWDLVKEIGEREIGVLSTEILNELIELFWKVGKGKAAREVFDKFEEFGCDTNPDSYYLTIKALCRRSCFDWACNVCEKMLIIGKLPDGNKIGEIICLLCKGDKAKDAHLVYLMAKEKNMSCPRSDLSFLISSLCKVDDTVKLASDTLSDFSGDGRKYAIKSFTSVVFSLCRMKELDEAKKLLFKMIDEGPPPGNAVFNYLITGLSKVGELNEAKQLVEVMESRGLRPDVYTYSVIMSGYVKGGEMDEAQKVLSVAKSKHSKLCPVMFHILIRGYCKLEEFEKAVALLKEMKESGVEPNTDEYDKMIQSLCLKALDWRTAGKLLEEMKENGLHPKGNMKALIRSVKELEEEELSQEDVRIEA